MLFVSRQHPARLIASSSAWRIGKRGIITGVGKNAIEKARTQEEERLHALDRLASGASPLNFDFKAQRMQIFDLRFPSSILSAPPGIKSKLDWAKTFFLDKIRSVTGQVLPHPPSTFQTHPHDSLQQAYRVGLIAPPRPSILSLLRLSSPALSSTALSLYTQMGDAFARGDVRALARACSEEQFDKLQQRIKVRPKGQTITWKMDEENSRADILSLRCVDAWAAKKPEDFCVQALVRFDTRQSIAVYGPGGKLVSGDPNKTVRIREHLILEKKNWIGDIDWAIRAPK